MPGFRSETSIPSHAVWNWWCHGELSYVESSDHIPLTSTKDPTRTRVRSLRLCVIYLMILLLYGMDPRGVRKQVCSKSPLSAPFPSVCPLLGFMVENVQNQGLRAWVQAWGGKARDDISSSSEGCRTCVCVHVCVHALPMLHHKLGVCSQQSLYEDPAALKQLCRQSAWPAQPALEMRYGGQPHRLLPHGYLPYMWPFPSAEPLPHHRAPHAGSGGLCDWSLPFRGISPKSLWRLEDMSWVLHTSFGPKSSAQDLRDNSANPG